MVRYKEIMYEYKVGDNVFADVRRTELCYVVRCWDGKGITHRVLVPISYLQNKNTAVNECVVLGRKALSRFMKKLKKKGIINY